MCRVRLPSSPADCPRLTEQFTCAVCGQVSAIVRSSSGPINSTADQAADSGRAHSESGPYGSK